MPRSFIVFPLPSPGTYKKVGGTPELLCFKWLNLRLRSPLVPVFPQSLRARKPQYFVSLVKHGKPDTPLSSIPAEGIGARRGIVFQLPRLTLALPERAAPGSGLSALDCRCCTRSCSFSLIPDLYRCSLPQTAHLFDSGRNKRIKLPAPKVYKKAGKVYKLFTVLAYWSRISFDAHNYTYQPE